ncbi:bifunctional folylpolyglutamate synthase/dihydrofolate synthase [Hydrogenimonas sp.]
MSLQSFLNTKPLYYDKIDLSRMPRAYESIRGHLDLGEVIHLVGTNGKGSTGRIIATLLQDGKKRVGHYSSPHILRFNERIWIDGADIDDIQLKKAHEKLMRWLDPKMAEELSYFEYTTLLALVAFEGCEYIVLEAGLGGEFDATNVVSKSLSVITPIGIDHQAFLGDDIEEIAKTKLRSIDRRVILAKQPEAIVVDIAREISDIENARLYQADEIVPAKIAKRLYENAAARGWPHFLADNALTAWGAVKLITGRFPDTKMLNDIALRGRFEKIDKNIILDVGHNVPAAKAISQALCGQKRILVYNALEDKDAKSILSILSSVISKMEIIPIESDRTMERSRLIAAAEEIGLEVEEFRNIDSKESYLVFGSFAVAEAFLKYSESLAE